MPYYKKRYARRSYRKRSYSYKPSRRRSYTRRRPVYRRRYSPKYRKTYKKKSSQWVNVLQTVDAQGIERSQWMKFPTASLAHTARKILAKRRSTIVKAQAAETLAGLGFTVAEVSSTERKTKRAKGEDPFSEETL